MITVALPTYNYSISFGCDLRTYALRLTRPNVAVSMAEDSSDKLFHEIIKNKLNYV